MRRMIKQIQHIKFPVIQILKLTGYLIKSIEGLSRMDLGTMRIIELSKSQDILGDNCMAVHPSSPGLL